MQLSPRARARQPDVYVLNAKVLPHVENSGKQSERAHRFRTIAADISLTVRIAETQDERVHRREKGEIPCVLRRREGEGGWWDSQDALMSALPGRAWCASG